MASFNIRKGLEASLPSTKADGTLYFCTDTGNLYVDYKDGENLIRKLIDKSKFEELNLDINNLQNDLNTHKEDIIKHITSTERTKWNDAYDLANTAKMIADEKAVVGTAEIDDAVAGIKDVSVESAPYAKVLEIGGMTRKCTNILPSAVATVWNCTCTVESDGKFSFTRTENGGVAFITTTVYLNANKTYIVNINATNTKYGFITKLGTEPTPNEVIYGRLDYTPTESGYYEVILYMTDESTAGTTGYAYIWINDGEYKPYEPYFDGLRSAPVTEVESVGKCLFPASAVYGFGAMVSKDGRNCYKYTSGADHRFIPIKFKENTQYTIKVDYCGVKKTDEASFSDSVICFWYTDGTYVPRYVAANGVWATYTFVSDKNKTISTIGINVHEYRIDNYIDVDSFRVVEGAEIADDCLPYRRNTLPIPAEVQALDGYGWGINADCYNYIDLERKQLVKRVERVDLGTLDWEVLGSLLHATFPTFKNNSVNALCHLYSPVSYSSQLVDKTFCKDRNGRIYLMDSSYTDAATFKAAMSGVMLYYELAEPVITDISDLLPDDNLIGVESGGTVTLVNEYGYDVPNKIEFYKGNNDILGANKFVGDLEGTASTATKLATARTISLTGDVTGSVTFDGSANASIEATVADNSHNHIIDNIDGLQNVLDSKANFEQWDCTVTCATWSRLCHIACGISIEGTKFILNIAATRNSVVYNDTFIITAHHNVNGKIIKIAGSNYSAGYKIRLLSNSNGDAYVELYDDCIGATNSIVENVHCRLIPIFSGIITKYTTFTDGTNIPSGYNVVQTMTTTNDDLQGNLGGTARYAVYDANSGAPLIHTGNIGSQSVNYANSAGSASYATYDSSGNTIASTYATKTELTNGLAGKANTSHTHTKSQITDFPSSLPASDVYSWAKASSKPSYSWNEITSKPSTFTPASHTHDDRYYTESEVNNLVNGRAPAY